MKMTDIDKLTQAETIKNYREFSTKAKIRLIIFVILWLISYIVCTISLFFWKWFIVPAISFILLFLLIYFIALDCYKIKFRYILLVLFWIFLFETISFIIILWFSRYLVAELVLFNTAIWTLLFLLDWQLDHRTGFSPFAYFTEWWFFVTTLLTVFFCVLMVWKYTQIPFTCDDIEKFPNKIAETTINPFKNTWNKIVSRFKEDEEETLNIPEFYAIWNPLNKSTDLASADSVEKFFTNIRNTIEDQTVGITNQVSKSTCNHYIKILQKTQKSWGIQIAWIVIGYLLLVWIFKILLWVVSVIWFILFVILRIFSVYKYEKRLVEKEVIV
jgi:hypothetical protein